MLLHFMSIGVPTVRGKPGLAYQTKSMAMKNQVMTDMLDYIIENKIIFN